MLRRQLKYFFIIIFSSLLSIDSMAEERYLNFMNLSSRDGLSSNIVNIILKDRYGFMWFGTDDGLNKFDGKEFKIYKHNSEDPSTIPTNEIVDLHEDRKGNLWIATAEGLVLYDRKTDSFKKFEESTRMVLTAIHSDQLGNIWLTGFNGILIFNPETGQFSELPLISERDKHLASFPMVRLFRDCKGRMWLASSNGLLRYIPEKKAFKQYIHSIAEINSLSNNAVKAIYEDKEGSLWVGTDGGGVSRLLANEKGFKNYSYSATDQNTLSSNLVYSLSGDVNGKIWIGTEEGLNILDSKTGKVLRVEGSGRDNFSMVGNSVKNILVDDEGISWVATFRGGINKYDKNLPFFNLKQSNTYDKFGLSAPVVTSFAEAIDGNIYVGTDGGGLNAFDIQTGVFHKVPLVGGFNELAILSMEKVGSEIWIGTFLNGLFILDTKTGISRHIKKGNEPYNISSTDIFSIKKDSRGNVWIGTNGQGVARYDSDNKVFHHFAFNRQEGKNINLNGYIRVIEEDSEGKIWIGSNGEGIAVYDPISGYVKNLNRMNSKLPNSSITTIHPAKGGGVWIGTRGGGLTFYNAEDGVMTTYSEKDGLANGVIYKILEDSKGKIWISTNHGISSLDLRTKKFKNYSYYNGIQRGTFVLGAGLKLADGSLFFGGTNGFNYFNPLQLNVDRKIPKLLLTDLKVSNQSVIPSEDAQINKHIGIAKEINLNYKQNFSLSFIALNYTSPQENRYFYKLENFDQDWNDVGSSNTAVYTNLDPGEYIFKVKASSESGEWNTPEVSIKVYVHPPFWLTYYAYAFYILLATLILLYIRYRGIQKLKAKFLIEQEKIKVKQLIEQERREAERVHEFDQLKIKFLTNISHEFRTPISLIMGPVEQLLQQEMASNSNQLKMIRRNAKRLLNLVNQLLDFRNIRQHEQKLNATVGDFIAFSRDVAESFKDLADRKQINFEFRSSVKFYFANFDHDKLERVLFNLLSNAFKFTLKGGEVIFKVDQLIGSTGLKVTLSDTGIGMDESVKEKIFDRFFQNEADPAILNQGSGIGLSITKEFVRMHEGTIEVESIAGKGSVFTIHFPFQKVEDTLILEEDAIVSEKKIAEENSFESEDKIIAEARKPVILLVEDNEDFRFYLKDNLQHDYQVVEADNGRDGWQKILSSHPDIVVSDISMPYMSGIELCRKIKADKRTNHTPVLLLTALTGEEDQLLGLETGANDYMMKPFNFDILNVKIRNLLTLNESLKNTYSKRINVLTPEIEVESDNEKLLNKVIQYIESNLTNPQLSVEDLSRHIGMSRGSLYTKVLELTGESPVEFIRSLKLNKAVVLLDKSDMNISQISYAVGFTTPNYFARAFKAKFNMLPSEYMNLKRCERSSLIYQK